MVSVLFPKNLIFIFLLHFISNTLKKLIYYLLNG